MARVGFSNGVLLIDSEQDDVDVSIKPTKDNLKLWGSVGLINYSIAASDVKSVVVIRNKATDKVWVDKSLNLAITYLDRLTVTDFASAIEQISQKVKP
jgi:hypothetical protein